VALVANMGVPQPVTDDDEDALPVALVESVPDCDGDPEVVAVTDGAADDETVGEPVTVLDLVIETMDV
jgi:hypothetical protein